METIETPIWSETVGATLARLAATTDGLSSDEARARSSSRSVIGCDPTWSVARLANL